MLLKQMSFLIPLKYKTIHQYFDDHHSCGRGIRPSGFCGLVKLYRKMFYACHPAEAELLVLIASEWQKQRYWKV